MNIREKRDLRAGSIARRIKGPVTLAFFAALVLVQAPAATAPGLPLTPPPSGDLTLPPETANTVTILEGRGVQIYTCTAQAGGYRWVFKAPEAQLFNLATGKPVGHHGAGPIWTLDDGSSVLGTVLHNKPGGTPADVPWLLLQASPARSAGSAPQGMLTSVNFVRRYNTHGGSPPIGGCDAVHATQETRVPYSASYAFYSMPGAPSNLQQPAPLLTVPPPPPPPPPPPGR